MLPEELLALVLWYLRHSIGPIRGLRYDYHGKCLSEPFSSFTASVNKEQRDDEIVLRWTLASCMQASKDLRRLAQALYYETIDADQLSPFVQRCNYRPEIASHVRERDISGQNGYSDPEKFL